MKTKTKSIIHKSFYVYGRYLTIPMLKKHYRIYSSRKANIYKKYHQSVRNSMENEEYFSLAAHKAHLTKRLETLNWRAVNHPTCM
jgi:hypothetical protein